MQGIMPMPRRFIYKAKQFNAIFVCNDPLYCDARYFLHCVFKSGVTFGTVTMTTATCDSSSPIDRGNEGTLSLWR